MKIAEKAMIEAGKKQSDFKILGKLSRVYLIFKKPR